MPYKHPNGCTCQTMFELLSDVGEREGKTVTDVWSDIQFAMDSDDRQQEKRWKEDHAMVLEELKKQCELERECTPDPVPYPIAVVSVEEVKCHSGFRVSSMSCTIVAVVRFRERGRFAGRQKKVRFKIKTSYAAGSFYEPPDEDVSIDWEDVL